MNLTFPTSFDTLRNDPDFFLNLYREGLLELERSKPQASEVALMAKRHEIHVVAEGSGRFFCDGRTERVRKGDVLYLDNGSRYRFSNLSENFSTWLFFGTEETKAENDPFRYLEID